MSIFPLHHMAHRVQISSTLERIYTGSGRSYGNFKKVQFGWLVGFRTIYDGRLDGDSQDGYSLDVTKAIHCAAVVINPRHNPVYVALDQYKLIRNVPDGNGGLRKDKK